MWPGPLSRIRSPIRLKGIFMQFENQETLDPACAPFDRDSPFIADRLTSRINHGPLPWGSGLWCAQRLPGRGRPSESWHSVRRETGDAHQPTTGPRTREAGGLQRRRSALHSDHAALLNQLTSEWQQHTIAGSAGCAAALGQLPVWTMRSCGGHRSSGRYTATLGNPSCVGHLYEVRSQGTFSAGAAFFV